MLHAKTAAVLYPDTASATPGALATEAALKAAGISVKMGPYPENATDLTGVLASTGAATADMVIPAVAAPDCVNIEKALTAAGHHRPQEDRRRPAVPQRHRSSTGLGGDFPKWTYLIASSLFGDTTDPGMIEYMKLAQTYSTPATRSTRG